MNQKLGRPYVDYPGNTAHTIIPISCSLWLQRLIPSALIAFKVKDESVGKS